jgi:hypothetical protein
MMLSALRVRLWFLWLVTGFGPFSVFNALWCEEPYLERYDPSRSSVGAYIGGYSNASMLLLALLFLYNRFMSRKIGDVAASAVALTLGVIGACVVAFLQSSTDSTSLWVTSFLAGACGNVCVFTLFSFASKFSDECTAALGTGLNMSGILIAGLGLLQRPGVVSDMRFSFSTMMLICGGINVLSLSTLLWLGFFELPRIQRRANGPQQGDATERTALIVDESINDAAVAALPARPRSERHLLRIVLSPCAAGLTSSVCAYFFNPGLVPFLSVHANVQSGLIFAYMIAATLGAFASVKVVRNLWPIVYVIAISLLYSCAVSSQHQVPLPELVLYFTTVSLAFFNGYVTTVNFLVADKNVRDAGRSLADVHTARGYAAVFNQLGVIGGSYACVAAVALGAFQEKLKNVASCTTPA